MFLDRPTRGPQGQIVTNCPICRADIAVTIPSLKLCSGKGNAKKYVKIKLKNGYYSLSDFQTPNSL
jgi:hypothetical protein